MPVAMTQPIRSGSYGSSSSQPACASASPAATSASCEKRSSRRTSLTERCSLGSKSPHAPAPSAIPHDTGGPALVQRRRADAERRDRAQAGDDDPALHGPVLTTARLTIRSIASPDRLELLHVLALEHHAVLVLDDLGQLDEIERVDVELLERGLAGDLVCIGAEARQDLDDSCLDLLVWLRLPLTAPFVVSGAVSGGQAPIDSQDRAGHVARLV